MFPYNQKPRDNRCVAFILGFTSSGTRKTSCNIEGIFKEIAMLKCIVDYAPLLIGAEGARLLREKQVLGDPTGALRRGGSRTARGKRAPGAEINRQVLQSQRNKLKLFFYYI
jgi:hypothetical protein